MHFKSSLIWTSCILLLFTSCQPSKYLKRAELKDLGAMLQADDMNHHMGFLLKDLSTGQTIKAIDENLYYTPASNTKVLSLALGMAVLGDSIPFIDYYQQGDTTYIRGLGDPTFLHPDFNQDRTLNFLKSHKAIVLDQSNFKDERYGRGWSWDDYNDGYQVERSAFPIYGNTIVFDDDTPSVGYFKDDVIYYPNDERLYIQRDQWQNRFKVYGKRGSNRIKTMPLVISDQLVIDLLQDTLNVPVVAGRFDPTIAHRRLYSHPVDSLYAPMMQHSDNFFAEQIVGMASQKELGHIDDAEIMKWAKTNVFQSPDELLWFDGSGLSRYNQFTVRSMVYLFQKLEKDHGLERLLPILAQGGSSGTIKGWYEGENGRPYVYAKTGTIRNVHCLSGYLQSDSGKWYVFSFMHNNFPGGSATVKKPMEKVLDYLRDRL